MAFLLFLTVPDDLVLQLLQNRLAQLDAVTRGWVIHGFPKTREQAESLTKAGYEPNRYKYGMIHPILSINSTRGESNVQEIIAVKAWFSLAT